MLDLTPRGLFPAKESPDADPRCVIISQIMQQLARRDPTNRISQRAMQDYANARYIYLAQGPKLSLFEAAEKSLSLQRQGVSKDVAERYYHMRSSE